MDESTQLIASLQHKLADLDAKVSQYRREMTAEYERYAESILSNAPKDASDKATKAVEATKSDYKNLHPDLAPSPNTNNVSEDGLEVNTKVKRRDREDRGIFDPPYLPLLDSEPRDLQSPNLDQSDLGDSEKADEGVMGTEVLTGTNTSSLSTTSNLQEAFVPKRRNTDEVSVLSDSSDSPVRRSALRRSSSSSKPMSPRRVRFDVEGKVVLPTASPAVTPSMLESKFKVREKEKYNRGSLLYDDDEDSPLSEQIEDIDSPPPPKRISSSQALRALSKTPIDDPSQWTTVTAGPDGSASIPKTGNESPNSSSDSLSTMIRQQTTSKAPSTAAPTTCKGTEKATKSADDEYESSDDELVFGSKAPKTRQKPTALSLLSPINTSSENNKLKPSADTTKTSQARGASKQTHGQHKAVKEKEQDADDHLFVDDEPTTKYQASSSEASDSEPDDEPGSAMSPTINLPGVPMSQYSSSPARAIPQSNNLRVPSPPAKGVVGSYRGQSIHIPVVSDEVHAQAAGMGPVSSFVGSLNGRSGLDESDMHSFRASGGYGSFSSPMGRTGGAPPRSLSERLMMEEVSEGDEEQLESSASGTRTAQNVGTGTTIQGGATQLTSGGTFAALGEQVAAATAGNLLNPSSQANISQSNAVN